MGHRILPITVSLVGLTLSACVNAAPPAALSTRPHGDIACTACHQGPSADRELAGVPPETCMQSDCHSGDIPSQLRLETVRFEHRDHGSTAELDIGCAGCHSHEEGGQSIAGSAETCGLCHQEELTGPRGEDCRVCHDQPVHNGVTNVGLDIPHEDLPWIENGCLRCHYEVQEPLHAIPMDRCVACHDDLDRIQHEGVGVDLHGAHTAVSCQSCHDPDTHRIESMSSAVELACADCHETAHEIEADHGWLSAAICVTCHDDEHRAVQALLLGIESAGGRNTPDEHFLAGATCRSCHDSRGEAECTGCHRPEYRTVERWWRTGIRQRNTLVDGYLTEAERAGRRLAPDAPARLALVRARERMTLLRGGEGVHNPPLAHGIFEDALAAARGAYGAAGAEAPPTPPIGRAPRSGFCSYCHYLLEDLVITEEMPADFHREVLGR